MLFVGAVPKICVEQVFRCVEMARVREAFVCCSGSFRFEHALGQRYPNVAVHSNDVSLFSTAIGTYAAGELRPFKFVNEFERLEAILAGRPTLDRVVALTVTVRMCHFRGKNEHALMHRRHFLDNFEHYIGASRDRVQRYLESLKIASFFAGDFREQAERAVEAGGTIFAWPPTHRGDYENFYRSVEAGVEWQHPSYQLWDPSQIGTWIKKLAGMGAPYVVCANHDLSEEGVVPFGLHTQGRTQTIYLYSNLRNTATIVCTDTQAEPFAYEKVVPDELTADTEVRIVTVGDKQMNFIKDVYQLPGLIHSSGEMSFLVYLGGKLAGGFVYASGKFNMKLGDRVLRASRTIYLLSDFSVSRDGKLSKLISMLATGREMVDRFARTRMRRVEGLATTAFTLKPASMKYRGIFELVNKKPGMLNYWSDVREQSYADIYRGWFRKYHADAEQQAKQQRRQRAHEQRAAAKAGRAPQAQGPAALGEERSLHAGAPVQPAG